MYVFQRQEQQMKERNWIRLMNDLILKFGIVVDDNHGSFLLGTNININFKSESYICIYVGFKTISIGWMYN